MTHMTNGSPTSPLPISPTSLLSLLVGLMLVAILSGCGSRYTERDIPPTAVCHISGYLDPNLHPGTTIFIVNANGVQEDLEFRENAATLRRALGNLGYEAVSDISKADLAILLSFGVGEPRTFEYSTSVPIFQYVAGRTTTLVAGASTPNSISVAGIQITEPARLQYAGQKTSTEQKIVYPCHFRCMAISASIARTENRIVPVWDTTARCNVPVSDLRLIFPLLTAASVDLFGNDTRIEIRRSIPSDDEYASYLKYGQYPESRPLKFLAGGYRRAIVTYEDGVPDDVREVFRNFLYENGVRVVDSAPAFARDAMNLTLTYHGGPRYAVKITAHDALDPTHLIGMGSESDIAITRPSISGLLQVAWRGLRSNNANLVGCKLGN